MPRSHSNSRSAPAKFTSKPTAAVQKPVPQSLPAVSTVGQGPSFGQTLKEGFAFGVGSSVARNVVDRMFSPSAPTETKPIPKEEKSQPVNHDFVLCMQESKGDYESCKQFM